MKNIIVKIKKIGNELEKINFCLLGRNVGFSRSLSSHEIIISRQNYHVCVKN